jgi:hypothetical protein
MMVKENLAVVVVVLVMACMIIVAVVLGSHATCSHGNVLAVSLCL